MLHNLEPASVFQYFQEISQIPRGSGNTKQISDYLVSFAKAHKLRYVQDSLNNVIMFKNGTSGYEQSDPVILQGHMDMVCEKDADCTHDFEKDGLTLCTDGDWLYAEGTTLGADDGIALAYALALLDADDIPHPPLEIVLTVDEETGMDGAFYIDLSMLKGRRMLNLDSEEEGHLLCGCAGGRHCVCTFDAPVGDACAATPADSRFHIKIDGLLGGHSGTEINTGRVNANKLMAELLFRMSKQFSFGLFSLEGGSKDNAIPRSAGASLAIQSEDADAMQEACRQFAAHAQKRYAAIEPQLTITCFAEKADGGAYVSQAQTLQIIAFLFVAPDGVQTMSTDVDGLVETSLNLANMRLADGKFTVRFSLRSMYDDRRDLLAERLNVLAEAYGAAYETDSAYPGWAYRRDSALRDTLVKVYEAQYGKQPAVEVLHAGLECGILQEKIPGLDCVSLGPNTLDIHTPAERLSISSTQRVWQYLLAVLRECR